VLLKLELLLVLLACCLPRLLSHCVAAVAAEVVTRSQRNVVSMLSLRRWAQLLVLPLLVAAGAVSKVVVLQVNRYALGGLVSLEVVVKRLLPNLRQTVVANLTLISVNNHHIVSKIAFY